MKPIHIFKAGKHVCSAGTAIEFTEDHLKAAAAAYDPAVHEAPIVIGHPAHNGPAYGWVGSLAEKAGNLHASPRDLAPEFEELVVAGRFRKVSASFYTPDSPQNPTPGNYYLRHVGFLGAAPPAIKGLDPVAFEDGEDGVIEFEDVGLLRVTAASLWRRMREWMIGKHGIEEADRVVPDYLVQDLEAEARNPPDPDAAYPQFTEPTSTGDQTMTEAEKTAAATAAAQFAEKEAALVAREAALVAKERAIARADSVSWVDGQIAAGRMLPRHREPIASFLEHLSTTPATVEFTEGEGDKAKTASKDAAAMFREFVEGLPKSIDFTEHAGRTGRDEATPTPTAIADRARRWKKSEEDAGREISFAEAVAEVTAGMDTKTAASAA